MVNNKYLVSIIIPVYNAERYLEDCIESILKQTYKNYEVLLIDDGSKDNSGNICDRYSNSNNNITVIHTENRGPSHARNTGILHAKGEWICFVDSDDTVTEHWLESYMKYADADLLIQGLYVKSAKTSKNLNINAEYKLGKERDSLINKLSKLHGLLNFPFKCFRSSIIQKNKILFKEGMSLGEDYVFVITFMKYSESIRCIPCCNYIYNQFNSTLSVRFYPANSIIEWNNISIEATLDFCKQDTKNIFFQSIAKNLFCAKCRYTINFYDKINCIDKDKIFYMLKKHKKYISLRKLNIKYWIFYLSLIDKELFNYILSFTFKIKNKIKTI